MDRLYREVYGEPPDDGQMIRGQERDFAEASAYELAPLVDPSA